MESGLPKGYRGAAERSSKVGVPDSVPVLTAAADKSRSLLGWQPRHTDLSEILRHAWNWHSNRRMQCVHSRASGFEVYA